MPKTKISEFSATPANNTDIDSINIAEGCAPSGINDAIRELMAQLKDFQTGAVGDSFNGPIGATTASTGAFTNITASGTLGVTGVATLGAGAILNTPASVTLTNATGLPLTTGTTGTLATSKGGTNLTSFTSGGVVYASSSSALATGSALTFDGNTLALTGVQTITNSSGSTLTLDRTSNPGSLQLNFGGTQAGQVQAASGGGLIFFQGSSPTEGMRLTSTGLGIGTSSPQSKLHVSDAVAGGQLLVTNNETNNGAKIGSLATMHHQNAEEPVLAISIEGGASENILQIGGGPGEFNASTVIRLFTAANTTTTGGSERARIDSSGNLLVGTTDSSATSGNGLKVTAGSGNADSVSVVTGATSNAGLTTYQLYSTGAGAYRFYVGAGGTIFATSTTISAISDIRYKENVRDLDVGLNAVMALKPRLYDWKEGKGADIKNARGFIAQEFEEVFPDLIDTWKDPTPEGEEPYKSVRQDLIPVLVKAIQEQQAIIESLKARLDAANL